MEFDENEATSLALAPLRRLAGFLQTELAAFFGTSIALQETGFLQAAAEIEIIDEQGASYTVAESFGLGRDTTTDDLGGNHELLSRLGASDRFHGDGLEFFDRKIFFQSLTVDFVAMLLGNEETDAGNSRFAAADSFVVFVGGSHESSLILLR